MIALPYFEAKATSSWSFWSHGSKIISMVLFRTKTVLVAEIRKEKQKIIIISIMASYHILLLDSGPGD